MTDTRDKRIVPVFIVLIVLVIAAFLASVCIGNVQIAPNEVAKILLGGSKDAKNAAIIFDIRLPRAIMTFLLGGALAVAGFLLQTYFANPIAGPYILGISSGAKMMVALTLIFVVGTTGRSFNLLLILAAFAGALLSTAIIILLSKAVQNMAVLLAAGIMIGYICSAITDFLIAFADDADIVNLHGWSQGSFSGVSMENAAYAAVIIGLAFVCTMLLGKSLDGLRLHETYAKSVGVNVKATRLAVILLSSILSATVTAFAGPVSFIGIAVPFLMREILKTSKPILLLPTSFLAGAIFCELSDLIARQMFAPTELNVSAVTSLFGAPIVIIMMLRMHAPMKRR